MYADDTVIFFTSPEGLQNKLNFLHILKGYIQKTKLIIFNKTGKTIKDNFLFANQEVEFVSNYKYFGIHFTTFGTFIMANHELHKKELKAFFKLRNNMH